MLCFDTNVVIYLGNQTLDERIIGSEPICYASVSLVEALGYPDILASEEQRIKELYDTMIEIPLSASIIQAAVRLRQLKKMSLGDAIVAATALENDCVLWTANVEDFTHVDGLRLRNPLKT
jgi:predicted nucleic acid-binding protein